MPKKIFLSVFFLILFIAFVAVISTDVSAQCAMCKAVAKSGMESDPGRFGKGLNKGILYLLAMPYIMVGIGGFLWWRSKKKKSVS
jgi:hypothetical protein